MLYFFDTENGVVRRDERGEHYASDGAAEQEARLRALNFASSNRLNGYGEADFLIVRNCDGRVVCKVRVEH